MCIYIYIYIYIHIYIHVDVAGVLRDGLPRVGADALRPTARLIITSSTHLSQ